MLTFDDAHRTHLEVAAPILKKYGFGATFFVCQRWMLNKGQYMNWEEMAKLHEMGFEVGNHSWSHSSFNKPGSGKTLEKELLRVEQRLKTVGVPNPVSFAYPGAAFCPEAIKTLRNRGYLFGRRGIEPDKLPNYAPPGVGVAYDPNKHHHLIIPSSGVPGTGWTRESFRQAISGAAEGKIPVIMYHGIPDKENPNISISEEQFLSEMKYLKAAKYKVIAMRDLDKYVNRSKPPNDPFLLSTYP